MDGDRVKENHFTRQVCVCAVHTNLICAKSSAEMRVTMTCIETQRNMKSFMDDKLDTMQLEEFLIHIRSCESCREDLEVYYTIFESIKLLDEDKNSDIQVDFLKKMKRTEETVRRKHMRILYKRIIVVILSIIISLIIEK